MKTGTSSSVQSRIDNAVSRGCSRLFLTAVLLATALALAGGLTGALHLNLSASVPLGLYLARPVPDEIRPHQLFSVCLPKGSADLYKHRRYLPPGSECPGGLPLAAKRVLAVPGQLVVITPERILVDGHDSASPPPLQVDFTGRHLPVLAFSKVHRLTADRFWLYTEHPRSLTSANYGPVDRAAFRSRLVPLILQPSFLR